MHSPVYLCSFSSFVSTLRPTKNHFVLISMLSSLTTVTNIKNLHSYTFSSLSAAVRSFRLKGFVRKLLPPHSKNRSMSSRLAFPLTAMMGAVNPRARRSCVASNPSITGIMRSISTHKQAWLGRASCNCKSLFDRAASAGSSGTPISREIFASATSPLIATCEEKFELCV